MAVTTSAVWDVITQLLVLFRASSVLAANNVLVVDGPILTDNSRPNMLLVGGTASDPLSDQAHADFAQAFGELGNRARYEELGITCELWVTDGSTDLATRRTTAKTLLAEIESLLRTNYGLTVAALLWAHITSAQIRQIQNDNGSAVVVTFVISARARLATQ